MANEYVFLKGKTKWFRANQPDSYGNWKHQLWLDGPSLEKFRELQTTKSGVQGIKNVLQKDDDGYYVTIRRPQQKLIRGKVVGFAPPEVLDGSKTLPDGTNPPLRDVIVGNGSDIVTKIEVYSHPIPGGGRAKAVRWMSSRIDNLVPYEGRKDFTEDEERLVKGIEDQSPQMF